MNAHYILTDYIDRAIGEAEYDKLDDNSFVGQDSFLQRGCSLWSYIKRM